MILQEATIKYAGYNPDILKPKSQKKICVSCNRCGRVRWIGFYQYRDLCKSCVKKGNKNFNFGIPMSDKQKDKIDRFPSPLFFKPLESNNGYDVYIKINDVNQEFLNQEFEIKGKKGTNRNNEKDHVICLKTPSKFDFHDFFDFIITKEFLSRSCRFTITDEEQFRAREILCKLSYFLFSYLVSYWCIYILDL